jgi:hypothetical protein
MAGSFLSILNRTSNPPGGFLPASDGGDRSGYLPREHLAGLIQLFRQEQQLVVQSDQSIQFAGIIDDRY